MNRYILKDKIRRKYYFKNEIKIKAFNLFLKNQKLTIKFRTFIYYLFLKKFKIFFKSQIINRCLITGHSRFILRKFRLSRHQLKKYFNYGYVPALRQSSW